MPPKKTNIKIKRSKFNLYNKKKSKARRALTIIITIFAVCGLGVLGYGLGKPLLKYLEEKGNNVSSGEVSSIISSIIESVNSEISSNENQSNVSTVFTSTDNTGENDPDPAVIEKMYILPDNAALNENSLKAALDEAKKSGCSVVAVTLKNTTGQLLYKTSIAEVKDTDAVTGTLTAAQISAQIGKEGFIPAVRINTLMDRLGSVYINGNYRIAESAGGGTWLDNRVENGGKVWMSPFKSESVKYISNITDELTKAGFKHIICVNTRYPAFYKLDITKYLSDIPLENSAKRVEALWKIVDAAKSAAEKNSANAWIEISGSNLIAENKDCTDAELALNKQNLKNVNIAVKYDLNPQAVPASTSAAAPATSQTSSAPASSESTPSEVPNDTSSAARASVRSNNSNTANENNEYTAAKSFIEKAKTALGGAEFSVILPDTLNGAALENVTKAFTEAGIKII